MGRAKSHEWRKCVVFGVIGQVGEREFRQIMGFFANWWAAVRAGRAERDSSEPDAVAVVLARAVARMANRRDRGPAMIRQAIAGVALMVAASGQAATGEREFAEQMIERMRAAGSTLDLRVSERDPLVIEMSYEGAEESDDFSLHTFYKICAGSSDEYCDRFLNGMVALATTMPPALTAENLRVVVRQRDYLERLGPRQSLSRQIGDDLYALLAFTSVDYIVFANRADLRKLGLDAAAAWRLAGEQTRAELPELPVAFDLAEHVIGYQDYDMLPSLLADTEGWRGIARTAGPDLFATATSDTSVWVGVMPDGSRLEEFKRVVRSECEASSECISPNVYRFRDGRWVVAD